MATKPTDNETNQNEPFSLPKLFSNMFSFFSILCQDAADKELKKDKDKNQAAYLAARFFQHLFSAVAFLAEHILSWIISPQSILKDFQLIANFFSDFLKNMTNWSHEVAGDPSTEIPVDSAKKTVTQMSESTNTEISQSGPFSSTAKLMTTTFGVYGTTVDDVENVAVEKNQMISKADEMIKNNEVLEEQAAFKMSM